MRRWVKADPQALHHVMRNPAAMRYWSNLAHTDLALKEGRLARSLVRDPAQSAEFVIVLGDQIICIAGGNTLPEVGMILHPDH